MPIISVVEIPSNIQRAVAAFVERGFYHDPYAGIERNLDELRVAKNSECMCQDLSEQFIAFVEANHPELEIEKLRDLDPMLLGLTSEEVALPHTVVRVNGRFVVDFTASQYDETVAFPYLVELV